MQLAIFTVDILTCHSRKCPGITDIKNGCNQFNCASFSILVIRTLVQLARQMRFSSLMLLVPPDVVLLLREKLFAVKNRSHSAAPHHVGLTSLLVQFNWYSLTDCQESSRHPSVQIRNVDMCFWFVQVMLQHSGFSLGVYSSSLRLKDMQLGSLGTWENGLGEYLSGCLSKYVALHYTGNLFCTPKSAAVGWGSNSRLLPIVYAQLILIDNNNMIWRKMGVG